MKVKNIGLSSVFVYFPKSLIEGTIVLKQDDKTIQYKVLASADADHVMIEFHLKEFSIYKDLMVYSDSPHFSLYEIFDKYRLDQGKLDDESYVTRAIINAQTRNLDANELFFSAYNALSIIPEKNHFFGALITLMAYKYLEDPAYRGWILNVLFEAKKRFDNCIVEYTPNIVRWGISSSTALSLALLMNDRVNDAELLIDSVLENYEPNLNHLSYWNYCQCLMIKSTMLVYKGKFNEAAWKYLAAFDYSRKAINDTYNPRNDWVLNQILDCHALLNLGELALRCAAKILGTIPHESRYANIKYSGKISFTPIFSRFQNSRSKFKSSFFDTVEKKIGAF